VCRLTNRSGRQRMTRISQIGPGDVYVELKRRIERDGATQA
jgi:hypothetical protein